MISLKTIVCKAIKSKASLTDIASSSGIVVLGLKTFSKKTEN